VTTKRILSPTLLALLGAAVTFGAGAAHAEDAPRGKAVEYRHGDLVLEGWLVSPEATTGKRPGVLVVHAWKGLDDHAKGSAERLAAMGYVALAVDMYGKGVRPATSEAASKEAGKYKADRALARARVQAGLERLRQESAVDPTRIGAIGYCFGGMVVLELARSGADVAAVASFHGSLDTPSPEDMKRTKAKVLVLHGADDPYVPQEHVAALVRELTDAKADWALVQYGGAVHSFSDPGAGGDPASGSRYDEKAARRSWAAMADFFGEALGRSAAAAGPAR
jgi:dienelactone hydrolase